MPATPAEGTVLMEMEYSHISEKYLIGYCRGAKGMSC